MSTWPKMIYGTAWKKERTADLTELAISAGFRAIDTANQPKHYQEPLVGEALQRCYLSGLMRKDIFLQTKFTPLDGHDSRVPYDSSKNVFDQVFESFESSLKNLGTDYIDSYLLHGPYTSQGLIDEDWQAWSALEKIHTMGKVNHIGISNVNLFQLISLCENAEVNPSAVQNRCFAVQGWDHDVRSYCLEHGILYQGFSLLTANVNIITGQPFMNLAKKHDKTLPQIVFKFSSDIGILPLTGTTDIDHMKQDLECFEVNLSKDDIRSLIEI